MPAYGRVFSLVLHRDFSMLKKIQPPSRKAATSAHKIPAKTLKVWPQAFESYGITLAHLGGKNSRLAMMVKAILGRSLGPFTKLSARFGHSRENRSFSDDPKKFGAPKDWTLTVTDAHLASGAGFIVAVAGNMTLMPGLPKAPQAVRMSVDEHGSIHGL